MGRGERGGVHPIQDVLARVLRDVGVARGGGRPAAFDAWDRAAGEALARSARPVRFRRGELQVEVDSSVWLHELRGYTGETIRERANEYLEGEPIRRVVFRARSHR